MSKGTRKSRLAKTGIRPDQEPFKSPDMHSKRVQEAHYQWQEYVKDAWANEKPI